ncbi:hypothetical protein EDD22DRAFT_787453, partial [Suillus occidentalis]
LAPCATESLIPSAHSHSYTAISDQTPPADHRPAAHIVLFPMLELVRYGANISNILTHFTHPVLDIIVRFPCRVVHHIFPFVLAAFLWPSQFLHIFAKIFGYQNCIGTFLDYQRAH